MEISIQHLRKVYQDGKVALDDFNWEMDRGVFGLLGPNGAGKSTLLEILSLNLMPTAGRVLWRGESIQKHPHRFRRALGYLPQVYGFYPELTANQFLEYMARLHGLHGRRLRRRIVEVLEMVNLGAERKRKVKTLSGGMRQRLAIAQALAHSPEILVIDEPTTGLDPGERVAFRNMLFDLGRSCAILLSTHIVKDVEFSCHHMTMLHSGIQRFTGRPVDFITRVEGRVFEVTVPFQDFEEFSKSHGVIAIQERREEIDVRFIAPEKESGAVRLRSGHLPRPVGANLEDAYVDFIRELQEEERLVEDGETRRVG
ncbi:MAG TPA: ATP-binding cassette domain-containing protein [Sumerlaeia bacterium]|nr:ATP-binding cassette domain-containing protein [Sumerlaeia bacterium]